MSSYTFFVGAALVTEGELLDRRRGMGNDHAILDRDCSMRGKLKVRNDSLQN